MKRVDIKIRHLINLCIVNVLTVNALYAGCCGENDKKGKGCCGYGQSKDNNGINGDDDKKKKEEEDKEKEDDKKDKEDPLENKKSILRNKLKEVIKNNEKLEEKDRLQINIKEKDIDECKNDELLDKISKDLDKLNVEILKKIGKKDENLLKQIIIDKRKEIIKIFEEVDNLINEIKQRTSNSFTITLTKDKIQNEEKIEELNNFESDLNKQKLELTELYKKLTTDTPICEDQNEFITKFNERKNELISKNYFKNNDLNNKLEANNLTEDKISDYYSMYQEMTNDIFTHEIALDLQIYRYILKLEGFIDALDNIIKKDRIRYDFFTEYSNGNADYNTEIFKEGDNYYLDYFSEIDTKKYVKIKNIYSGIFYIDNESFKYVRCKEDNCNYVENEKYCISCKLRKLLENEDIGDLYGKIYKDYGGSSEAGDTVRPFIFSNIKSKYVDKHLFFRYINLSTETNNNKDYIIYDYENGEEKYKKIKKVLMLEWALTIEFMKRFIPEFTGKNEFYLYRTMGFKSDTDYKPVNELLSQTVDSTSLFGPCYFQMSNDNIICFHKIKAKLYCCFFNHIINPFSEEKNYKGKNVKDETGKKSKMFLKGKLLGDYECEIGYIPVNQKYTEEVKCHKEKNDEFANLYNYIFEKSVENFKQNMLNDPNIKNSKLYVFLGNEIIDLN